MRGYALLTLPSGSLIIDSAVSRSACSSRVELLWRLRLQVIESETFIVRGDELLRVVKFDPRLVVQSIILMNHFPEVFDKSFCRSGLSPLAHFDLDLGLYRFPNPRLDLCPTNNRYQQPARSGQ